MSTIAIQQRLAAAQEMVNNGRLQDAVRIYGEINRLDPTCVEAWMMLGVINGEVGHITDAVSCLRTALALQPENAELQVLLARVLCAADQLDEALDYGLRAVQIMPDSEQAWLLLSGIYGQLGYSDECERCARRTLELLPDCTEALSNLGNALSVQNRAAEAAQVFTELTQLDPSRSAAWLSLAEQRMKLGDINGAEACYRTVLVLEPGSPEGGGRNRASASDPR